MCLSILINQVGFSTHTTNKSGLLADHRAISLAALLIINLLMNLKQYNTYSLAYLADEVFAVIESGVLKRR